MEKFIAPIKYVGSKRKQIDFLMQRFRQAGSFHDVFCGTGQVGINYGLNNKAHSIHLNDANPRIERYLKCLAANGNFYNSVMWWLADIYKWDDLERIYTIYRDMYNNQRDSIGATLLCAIEIFLGSCSYGGLWGVNKKGHFNVPFSRDSAKSYGKIRDKFDKSREVIKSCGFSIYNYNLDWKDYIKQATETEEGERVAGLYNSIFYFDPPYAETFNSYTEHKFCIKELREKCDELIDYGALVAISEMDSEKIRTLFRGYSFYPYQTKKAIGSNRGKIGDVTEVLIMRG